MSNILMKCNLEPDEQARVFKEFDGYLTNAEEDLLSRKFTQYCFYETWDRKNYRDCFCTCCGHFDAYKDEQPKFFSFHHKDEGHCPNCGEQVTFYSLGRMQTGSSLKEWQRAAFVRKASDGGLLLISGYATKDYSPYDLRPHIDWNEKTRTYLAPGKRMQWRRDLMNYWNMFYCGTDGTSWYATKSIEEPFKPAMMMHDGSYWLINSPSIEDTSLKYCQLEDWYHEITGVWLSEEQDRCRQVYKYLARYTEYPQMELAVKIGMHGAVEELVMDGRKNHKLLNWRAKTVQGFLRMNKQDAKVFIQAEGDIRQLEHCRAALSTGTVKSVQEYIRMVDQVGSMDNLTRAATCAELAGVDIKRAVKYIRNTAETWKSASSTHISQVISYWKDYLDNALVLDLDLKNKTVAMPKNLEERHDAIAQMIRLQASEAVRKKYMNRYKKLRSLYEFRLGDLCIVIPERGEDIVAEGKTLQHCVGGYAGRHIEGKVDILFLRHVRKPHRSFLTIEMWPRNSVLDPVRIKQIHGYKNENYKGSPQDPAKKYAWFLDVWQDWQRKGSKRDKNGMPVLPEGKEHIA